MLDLNQNDNLSSTDPNKSYRALRNIIDTRIWKEHEEYNRGELERSIHQEAEEEARRGSSTNSYSEEEEEEEEEEEVEEGDRMQF